MKFSDFTYVGRTAKCVILTSDTGSTVYCLFCIFKWLVHNPSLKWEIIDRVHPKKNVIYKFIKLR